jgi:FkbM family methyltransferase
LPLFRDVIGIYKKHYTNYLGIMLAVKRNKYPITAKKHDGSQVIFRNKKQLTADILGMKYDHTTDVVYVNGLLFSNGMDNGNIYNIFYDNDYSFLLPLEDKTVIDIGANIADSSIYFAHNGAKKVIALEPFAHNYVIAKRNIDLNGMQNVIELLNAGCTGTSRTMILNADGVGVYEKSAQKSNGTQVIFYSLAELLNTYQSDNLVLKLDCEGCEDDIIPTAECETLQRFSKIQIEYHYDYKQLKQKLETCGFSVKMTEPRKINDMQIGWIYATLGP